MPSAQIPLRFRRGERKGGGVCIRKIPREEILEGVERDAAREKLGEHLGCLRVVLIYFVLADWGLGVVFVGKPLTPPRYVILPDGPRAYIDLGF